MKFTRVDNLPAAYQTLAQLGPEATLLAGGTDVMVQYHAGQIDPAHLVHLHSIPELSGIHETDGSVEIGALVSHHEIGHSESCRRRLPALAAACATVGGLQTQVAGTIGGNLCNASPAADTPPALLIADAVVHVGSARGMRSVPLDQFIRGRRDVDLAADELVLRVVAEPLPQSSAEVYLKVGARSAMEVALVGLAVRVSVAGQVIRNIAIAATAVGPRPFRASAAEDVLRGTSINLAPNGKFVLNTELLHAAGEDLMAAADPIDDVRSTATYRRSILSGLLRRGVQRCLEQISRASNGAVM